jgi:hypothetical protein
MKERDEGRWEGGGRGLCSFDFEILIRERKECWKEKRMFLEKEERQNLIENKRQKYLAGKQVNNLAGRKSDRGRRPEKEWQIIGIFLGMLQ